MLKEWQQPNPARDNMLFQLRERGWTYEQIAKANDLTVERVRKIIIRETKNREDKPISTT